MKELVSRAERTQTELLANRRRFQREGVTLTEGPPNARFTLPIVSRREITARPAVRLCDNAPSLFDTFLTVSFDRFGYVLLPIMVLLVLALVTVQIAEHFRWLHGG